MVLTSVHFLFPLPAISPHKFTSIYGRCFVAHTTTYVMLQLISFWLYGSGQAAIIPDVASVVVPRRLCRGHHCHLTLIRYTCTCRVPWNAVYASIVDNGERLWRHIQNAVNHSWGVRMLPSHVPLLTRVFMAMEGTWSICCNVCKKQISLRQGFCVSDAGTLYPWTSNLQYPFTVALPDIRSSELFKLYWLPKASLSFVINNTEALCTDVLV
jgi:hypothetical protein